MAAPSFIGIGTPMTDAGGAWSFGFAAAGMPTANGQILIVQILQDGTTSGAITGVNWPSTVRVESLDGTDSSMDYLGEFAGGGLIQHLWIGRSLNFASGLPTIAGNNSTSEDLYGQIYVFDSVNTGTTLADVIEQNGTTTPSTTSGTSTTIADAGVTTTGPDRLALQFVGVNDDNAVDSFTGETGGDWTEATPEYAEAAGTDGCIQLQTSAAATATTIDGGSYTMAASDGWGVVGFALIGTTPSTRQPRYGFVNFQDPGVF